MNQTCPECGAEIGLASLFGAIPSKLDCSKCGASLVFDKQEAEYRRDPASNPPAQPAGIASSPAAGDPSAPAKSVPPAAARSHPPAEAKPTPAAAAMSSPPTVKVKTPPPPVGASTPSLGKTKAEPRDPLSPTPKLTMADPRQASGAESSRGPSDLPALANEVTAHSPSPRFSAGGVEVSPSSPLPGAGASEVPEPKDSLVGRTIGGCEIEKWLGRGGMGSVYLARQLSLDRPVAFKVISESAQRDESFLRRFEREARTIARFNSSRIVQIYEVGFDQGIHFILMEYVPGGDLKKKTAEAKRVPPEQAAAYTRQAAEGLLAAERQKIVHRDLKPENLMLDANGEIKITDFGLAKMLQTENITLTQMGDYLGTPIYMSPEQAQGVTLDHRSDMYSLGATLYFLLTGVHPYTGGSVYEILKKKTEYEFLDPTTSNLEQPIPEGLCNIMRRMTALQPKDRYPSFEDLIEDLDRWQHGQPTQQYRSKRKGSLTKRVALVAVPLVLLAGGLRYRNEISAMFNGVPTTETSTKSPVVSVEDCDRLGSQLKALSTRAVNEGASLPLVRELNELSTKAATSCTSLLRDANNLMDETLKKLVEGQEKKISESQVALRDAPSVTSLKGAIKIREETKSFPTAIAKDLQERIATDLKGLEQSMIDGMKGLVAIHRTKLEAYCATLKKEGPSVSLTNDISVLQSAANEDTRQLALDVTDLTKQAQDELTGLKTAIVVLARDSGEAAKIHDRLDRLPAPTVVIPFKELPGFLTVLRQALKPPETKGPELSDWLDAEENRRLEEIKVKAEEALKNALAAAEEEKDRYAKGESTSQDTLLAMVSTLGAGKKALIASFPGTEGRWETAAPEARINDLTAAVSMRQGDQKRVGEISAAISAIDKLFPEPAKAAEWSPQLQAQVLAGIQASRNDLKALETKPALKPDLDKLGARLDAQEKKSAAFDQRVRDLAAATESFAAHRLSDAGGKIEALKRANPDDPRVDKLAAAKKSMDDGFTGLLRELNLSKARDAFDAARTSCVDAGLSTAYPDQCLERLRNLEALVRGKMAAVRSGRVQLQGAAEPVGVKGFFLDNTEVTIQDFLKFQEALKKKGFADVKGIWPSAQLFQRDSSPPPYLARTPDFNVLAPIEEVSYYQALAYVRDLGKDLFTLEEWWLAARGPVGSSIDQPREPRNAKFPKQADMEGEAYNLRGVRHLAGNVAEWTASKRSNQYCLVGTRYMDSTTSMLLYLSPEETKIGFGFRGIIRPEAFFEGLLEPAPAGAPSAAGSK
jgi:serine/threonine protein kinase